MTRARSFERPRARLRSTSPAELETPLSSAALTSCGEPRGAGRAKRAPCTWHMASSMSDTSSASPGGPLGSSPLAPSRAKKVCRFSRAVEKGAGAARARM